VLRLELTLTSLRRGIYTFAGKGYVDDKLVAEAELKATFAATSAEGKA
jgi:3-hydroxyacyl-[acyl-carrier-protein] dehydratase